MKCFLCKKNNFEKVYSLETKNILRCKNDGIFVADKTKPDKTYGKQYFSNEPNKFNKSYFLNKLTSIKCLIKVDKPKILDVGCGWGDFEEILEQEKIPYLGIDINKESIQICKKKGLNCRLLTIKQLNKEAMKQFDCITLFQVIEHLKDPISLLKSAKKLLKPDGIILITTPNNDSPLRKIMRNKWSVYSEPSHYIFFSKKTLEQTLQLTDFKKIETRIDDMRFLSLRYILNRLITKPYTLNRLPFTLIPNFPIPTDPFGDLETIAFMVRWKNA